MTASVRILQAGLLTIAVIVTTFHVFELDRFFVPKELVLHLAALLGGLCSLRASRRLSFSTSDKLLIGFLLLSLISALLATNGWLAARAVAITASSLLLLFIARLAAASGFERQLRIGVVVATVLVAAGSLLQAYGVETSFFAQNRAPGGTLGNRNFVAHASAIGWPIVVITALAARSISGLFAGSIGILLVTATLVLTRSRAGWLAFGVAAAIVLVSTLLCRPLRQSWQTWRRLLVVLLFSGGGVAAALLLPNDLRWRSQNPYLESVERLADYREGSGRGRLVQYERSLLMSLRNPIFGVGPGNWAVEYPEHAARNDPSLDPGNGGTTSNPWPSSDWMAFVSERGVVAAALLAFALLLVALDATRRILISATAEEGFTSIALLGTIAATIVAGAFDAVLLLAVPSMIFWIAVGAMSRPAMREQTSVVVAEPNEVEQIRPELRRRPAVLAVLLVLLVVSAAGVWRSGAQIAAMQIFTTSSTRARLEQAARIDPGNYRLRLRLARLGPRARRCAHARAARALYPSAHAAQRLARGCD